MISRETLERLATAHGVATHYRDAYDHDRAVDDHVIVAVLAAMGVRASSEAEAARQAEQAETASWRELVEPTQVITRDDKWEFVVATAAGQTPNVTVHTEDGRAVAATRVLGTAESSVDGVTRVKHYVELPGCVPDGYHRIQAQCDGEESFGHLIVAPGRIPEHPAQDRPRHGMAVQLYSVTSKRSWGMGDFADLADLAAWGSSVGADFVLINPVHASSPVCPQEPSPYLPTSRRFANPAYLRPEAIEEAAYLPTAMLAAAREQAARLREELLGSQRIDRDSVWQAKDDVLRAIFAIPRSVARRTAFADYRERGGEALENFALWCALAVYSAGGDWPADAGSPRDFGTDRYREELADDVEYFCWLQWQCEQQLAASQRTARDAGMAYGVITDLAVGVHPSGADAWCLGDALASGVTVGAPPDVMNSLGQDWSQPPWRPSGLAASGYRELRDVLSAATRHSGGVRIDHVMGLFRLWWIPAGMSADQGTYVSYDDRAMLAVLTLEASRHGVVVIGEDLGTVEPRVREKLRAIGALGTSVLWFEQTDDGLVDPADWREHVFATVTTHDLPTTPDYLAGDHVAVRHAAGVLPGDLVEHQAAAAAEIERVRRDLVQRGLIEPATDRRGEVIGLHAYLARTPAIMKAWSLTDAVGEKRQQNVPGTYNEYPNWRIPLGDANADLVLIDQLPTVGESADLARVFRDDGCPPSA